MSEVMLKDACERMQRYNADAESGRMDPDNAHDYWESVMSYVDVAVEAAKAEEQLVSPEQQELHMLRERIAFYKLSESERNNQLQKEIVQIKIDRDKLQGV